MSSSAVKKAFEGYDQKPVISNYEINGRKINYAASGADSLPTVIFFHGAPGSWSAFIDYFKNDSLLKHVKLVSVDRPGYGHSNFGNSVTSLDEQAFLVKELLEAHKNTKNILVGHSLGGPIIAKIAMNYPHLVDALIMVAPSIDPELEPNEDWFRMPLHTPFLRWILPASLRVTNDEIYFLEDELVTMENDWYKIEVPTTVIHGDQDQLVPVENALYAQKKLKNAAEVEMVIIKGLNHFVPWNRSDLIVKAIEHYAINN